MALEAMQRNGHNLGLGVFECEGLYDTPMLVPVHFNEKADWISFNCAGTDRNAASTVFTSLWTITFLSAHGMTPDAMRSFFLNSRRL